jgi:predicted type IV restriction endonuclease
MLSKEAAYTQIETLVERFTDQLASYKKADYNETLTRRDFIDPFFKALGWDVDNSNGYAEAYREVIHEDKIKIAGATKAPDYSFRLPGGKRLFFVEAKKPSVVVKDDVLPAYQVRRYAWSAKMPISILTDFEELAIYDCYKKPSAGDKASAGRIKYLTFKDYLNEFDFIWDTFSKERVLKGSFDKFIAADKHKKGTATVDKEFLASLDEWRKQLALNIALRNETFTEEELNFTVQQTLDRIIFLRIAEDRAVEEYGRLQKSLKGDDYYSNLFAYFKEADEKYNSGLFDFKKDKLSNTLVIDNKVIKSIINELYYPISPYEFSVLSVEILGSAYEQFLGKQIKLTAGHRAVIEEKPEVRKAGGVYYTPQYIVDYIVENTVGKLCEAKKPEQVTKIKIVDPACGSGSFLLGAYQYLLNWHSVYYKPEFERLTGIAQNNKEYNEKQRTDAIKDRNKLPLTPDGNLTTALKKQILLNNIYGVDIDTQAVEVTKLSLLLKCLEGETGSSIMAEIRFGERILPTLDSNIKCGNSLVDIDFYDGQLDFEPGLEKTVKPFSWQQAFPDVFKQGWFDAVIGNPPYVRQELLIDYKKYFQKAYKVYDGMADLYSYFFEKGIGLLNKQGLFGIIVANKWMRANYGEPLRRWLKNESIEQIVDFGDLPVFQGATTYPCIFIAGKSEKENIEVTNIKHLEFNSLSEYVKENKVEIKKDSLKEEGWNLSPESVQELLKKIQSAGVSLGEYVNGKIYRGLVTGFNDAFIINETTKNEILKEDPNSSSIIRPFLTGRDVKKYLEVNSNKYLLFIPWHFPLHDNPKITGASIEAEKQFEKQFPAVFKHLLKFKKELSNRNKEETGKRYEWYALQRYASTFINEFDKPKIISPAIVKSATYCFDKSGILTNDKTTIIQCDDLYLLGVLNSKCCDFYLKSIASTKQGGYYEYKPMYISKLPIKVIDKKNTAQKLIQNEITKLVDNILQLQRQRLTVNLSQQIEQLEQRIQYTDNSINQKVYELYELTDEEIKIIESSL